MTPKPVVKELLVISPYLSFNAANARCWKSPAARPNQLVLCLLLWMWGAMALAEEPAWQWDIGGYWGEGDYGVRREGASRTTRLLFIPLSLRWREQQWQLSLASGWLSLDGPGNPGERVTDGESAVIREAQGIADTFLQVRHFQSRWQPLPLYTDVGVKLKLPTASRADGLGTGEPDLELDGRVYWWRAPVSPFLRLAYRWRQQPERANYTLDDTWRLTLGGHYTLNSRWDLTTQLDARSASSPQGEDALDATILVRHKLSVHRSVSVYLVKGFADGSPDWAAGIQHSQRF